VVKAEDLPTSSLLPPRCDLSKHDLVDDSFRELLQDIVHYARLLFNPKPRLRYLLTFECANDGGQKLKTVRLESFLGVLFCLALSSLRLPRRGFPAYLEW